jgi:copper chaperone CopZ
MSDHQYKFNVTMTCGGCSGAVERVLKKLEGERLSREHAGFSRLRTFVDLVLSREQEQDQAHAIY